MPAVASRLEILELGLRDYVEAWELQKLLVAERLAGRRPDTLVLAEHPPVYTRGTNARSKPSAELPFPVHDVERGGDITYHGPGQLVGYPIIHLKERGLTVGAHLRGLEAALIAALAGLGVSAERLPGFTGVWSGGKKLAAIGVAVRGWVAYHGFALNVACDLAPFRSIRPCGLEPERVTSVSELLGRPASLAQARAAVAGFFQDILAQDGSASLSG